MQLRLLTTLSEAKAARDYIMDLKQRHSGSHKLQLSRLGKWNFIFDKDVSITYNEAIDLLDDHIENYYGGHCDDI